MRSTAIELYLALLLAAGVLPPAQAQMATIDEARNVAANWVTLVIQQRGDWGGAPAAQVGDMQPFTRGARLLGYYCPVAPAGYVLVAARQELAAVKAYSTAGALADPAADEGMADLLKGGLERMLDAVEARLGPIESVSPAELAGIVEVNYAPAWTALAVDPATFAARLAGGALDINYQAGQVLTLSSWHQYPPYNNQCPNMGCNWSSYGNFNQNALVGCVATAGAQLMRYWNWPPYGVGSPYNDACDWPDMLDRYVWSAANARFEDMNGNPVTQAQIDAVAELCHEVGLAVGMRYGCAASEAYTWDMEGVYENQYRYATECASVIRPDFSAVDWFNRIKAQCNLNRPVHYRIPGHSIVGDGWQELYINQVFTRQYHMNYGWGQLGTCNGCNTWYALDAIFGGNPADEYMLENIVPVQAVGSSVAGTYDKPAFPYRYFDQDATGGGTFNAGQGLQFLPNITVRCTSPAVPIRFYGSSGDSTRLFTRGDSTRGARIFDGCIRLNENGTVVFR